jgi:hypothetical protein
MNHIYIVKIQENLIEYLIELLTPHFYEGIKSIYDTAKMYSKPELVLKNFQNFLNEIPNWNNTILENEVKRIILETKYEKEILINMIKNIIKYSLIIYSLNNPTELQYTDNVNLDKFIWDTYKCIGKEIYLNPFILYDNLCASDINSNIILANTLIQKNIKKNLYNLMPIKNITDYLIQLEIIKDVESTIQKQNIIDNSSIELNDFFKNIDDKLQTKSEIEQINDAPPIPPIIPPLNIIEVIPNNQPEKQPSKPDIEKINNDNVSRDDIIQNDEIRKLSSSDNIKLIENELKQNIEQQGGVKENTDLIKKLDKDMNKKKIELVNSSESDTSSNYANNEDNINVYSNAKTSSNSGVFVGKQAVSKYKNIAL